MTVLTVGAGRQYPEIILAMNAITTVDRIFRIQVYPNGGTNFYTDVLDFTAVPGTRSESAYIELVSMYPHGGVAAAAGGSGITI